MTAVPSDTTFSGRVQIPSTLQTPFIRDTVAGTTTIAINPNALTIASGGSTIAVAANGLTCSSDVYVAGGSVITSEIKHPSNNGKALVSLSSADVTITGDGK